MLEGMLASKGVVPPPAEHPPKTRQDVPDKGSADERNTSNSRSRARRESTIAVPSPPPRAHTDNPSPPDSADHAGRDDFGLMTESDLTDSMLVHGQSFQPFMKEPSPFRNLDPKTRAIAIAAYDRSFHAVWIFSTVLAVVAFLCTVLVGRGSPLALFTDRCGEDA